MVRIKIKPLSVNDAWKGRRFKTPEYEAYEIELKSKLPKLNIPKNTPLRLTVHVGFSSKASDLSNILKQFEDVLCKKYGIDDKWNYEIRMTKEIVKKGSEFVEFKIEVIELN